MNGDLSIAPQLASLDLTPGARRVPSGPVHSNPRDAGVPAPVLAAPPGLVPERVQQEQAARLKSLLTDPSVQVSTLHDDATGRFVLRVKSLTTGEVVDEIPSEELLRLYAMMRESLVDERA